jgi:hypothetical protein
VEIVVTEREYVAIASRRMRALARPLDSRFVENTVIAIRTQNPQTKALGPSLLVSITYVDRVAETGLCVLSLEPRGTTGAHAVVRL